MTQNALRTILVSLFIFSFMFMLNHWMPLHRDDYDYAMIWGTGVHLASLSDVYASAVQHYLLHGGRMMTVACLSAFLWAGKNVFDIANALMFLALVILITMHARRSLTFWHAPGLLGAAALLLWLCLPHFGEVAVWKSGSTVYLWSAVPAALFLLPYNLVLKTMSEGRRQRRAWAILPMLLLGIGGGWSVENLAVTVVLTTSAAALYARRTYGVCPPWMISGAVGALIGLIGLVAAPGNYVRYGEQGSGKGILLHLGNQIAGQGEMLLYLLPALLLIVTAVRLCRRRLAGGTLPAPARPGWGMLLLAALLVLLTVSYGTGGWAAAAIRDAVIGGVLTPLGFTQEKTIHLFTNVMRGFEEMAIYWLAVLLAYARIRQRLGLTADAVRADAAAVPLRTLLRDVPAVRYAALLMLLGISNNLVMLAAPTFPGRAAFSSAAMFITAALALLADPQIRADLLPRAGSLLIGTALALVLYTGISALLITHEMSGEDAQRIAQIKTARARGETTVQFPPIQNTNRALRHVFYEDWDNRVTCDGAKQYFGLTEITVTGK
ncbi:DUF6056 family protein [uncultured Selenomonas sp.]|uniref:DUF3329 domain-containing protein n=1 Tax=uncultured Selenomonas sp. TaxID=159275 RepID=UPI0028D26BD3|nr:DUF6056 family protein [uncultured Selenomonas sp.]